VASELQVRQNCHLFDDIVGVCRDELEKPAIFQIPPTKRRKDKQN
jgi:hypothetical protein